MGRDCEIMTIFAGVLWQKPDYRWWRVHGREPTTETRAETKLALALPCKEEEDRKVNHDIRKGAACALFLANWNLANSLSQSRAKQR
jgi:hypothetical protein